MPVRCTEDQDLVGEKDDRGKALSANAHSRISHLSSSMGTYERVNVNCLSLSPLIFMVVGPSLPQSTINSSQVSHYVNYVTGIT